jgi:hypothetical protein
MSLVAAVASLALILIVLTLYWLPSIVGFCRRRPDLVTVVVVNALLGWTMVGWVFALGRVLRPLGAHAAGTKPYGPGSAGLD